MYTRPLASFVFCFFYSLQPNTDGSAQRAPRPPTALTYNGAQNRSAPLPQERANRILPQEDRGSARWGPSQWLNGQTGTSTNTVCLLWVCRFSCLESGRVFGLRKTRVCAWSVLGGLTLAVASVFCSGSCWCCCGGGGGGPRHVLFAGDSRFASQGCMQAIVPASWLRYS